MPKVSQKLKTSILQAAGIMILGIAAGILINALRPDQLPWRGYKMQNGSVEEISLQNAWNGHQKGEVLFLDARDSWSFEEGHLPEAVHCPPNALDESFPKIQRLLAGRMMPVAYCDGEGCHLGEDLALALKQRGMTNVKVLSNGWSRWMQAGYPVERGKP